MKMKVIFYIEMLSFSLMKVFAFTNESTFICYYDYN